MNPITLDARFRDVDTLLQLGGLKTRCAAPLCCVEHGLNLPCEVCDLEGHRSVACKACCQVVSADAAALPERPCHSVAAFQQTGRIAFEQEALHALTTRQPHAALPTVPPPDGSASPAPVPSPAPQAPPLAVPHASGAPEVTSVNAVNRVLGASLLSALLGGLFAWGLSPFAQQGRSLWFKLGYGFAVYVCWNAALLPLQKADLAQIRFRPYPALSWGLVTLVLPAVGALWVCYLITSFQLSVWGLLRTVVVATLIALGIVWSRHLGIALSLDRPWPATVYPSFGGLHNTWGRIGVMLTLLADVVLLVLGVVWVMR